MRNPSFFPRICQYRNALLTLAAVLFVQSGYVAEAAAQKRLTVDDYRQQFHQRQEKYLHELEEFAGELQQAGQPAV